MLLENYPIVRQSLEVVGLSVFHTLWAGGLLLLLLMLVLRVMPTQLAKARFAVSLVALQLLFLLFIGIFFYQWYQVSPASVPAGETIAAPLPTIPPALPAAPTTVTEVNASPTPVPWLVHLQQWSRWWAALWLLGVAYHALQLLLEMRHTRQLRTKAQRVSGDWEESFGCLKQRLGIVRPVRFLRSDQTAVPLTFGWLKPVVLIPASLLTQLSPEQLEMIVLHELAHIRRHDYFWNLGQSVAEVVLFYHPAYWYIARVLEREREFACDQMTVSLTQQPQAYARTLLQVATTVAPNYGLAVSGKRGLSDRIKRIVTPTHGQSSTPVLPALILIGILGVASATFAMQRHHFGSGDGPKAQEELADSTGRDYGPSFEEVMAQVSDETLDTTRLTLDEIYANAITIDQDLNRMDSSIADYIAAHPEILEEFPPYSPINYSSPEVLYVVDGRVRNPKSIRKSEVDKISVFTEPEKANIKGVNISNYSTIVKASTKKGKHTSSELQASDLAGRQLYLRNGWGQITPQVPSSKSHNTTDQPNRWLYIVNDQVQTNRPTFLDGNYQADGWETRFVPAAGWWIEDYLTEEQKVVVDEDRYTGIVFVTSQDYRATQPKHLVYGTVERRPDEQPVPNLTVRIKGKRMSTTTDMTGYYQLMATNVQDTIEFLLDDNPVEVPIDGRRDISLITTADARTRERNQKQYLLNLTKRIEQKLPAPNKRDSVPSDGKRPPHQTNLVEQPLYIVDGMLVNDDGAQDILSRIDADSIKNIQVLKEAAATALYGTRAKHGVVLITTHRGQGAGHRPPPPQPLTDALRAFRSRSQPTLLTGQVSNWFTSEYVPGVQVVANDSATTVTDADGRYQFRLPSGTKEVSLAFSAPGYPTRDMEVNVTGKKHFHAVMSMVREDENAVIEALQTQPAQDSATTNTLIIVDGEPQYGKSWDEVDQVLKQNPLFSHYTLTSHGADSSQAILKALRVEEYDKVVSIDSWANLKKDGQIAPNKLEEFLQVFPNPTQDWFTLQFNIGEELPVTITILDSQGQPLTTLTDQTYPAGSHKVAWDASDQKPGVYFVQWTVGEQRVTRKVVIE